MKSYKEFEDFCKEQFAYSVKKFEEVENQLEISNKAREKEFIAYAYESTGGISGGSCWDDGSSDSHYDYTNQDGIANLNKSFSEIIDKILTEFSPKISYLKYRRIEEIIKEGTYTEYEYYGNCTYYAYKYFFVKDFYNKLVELTEGE